MVARFDTSVSDTADSLHGKVRESQVVLLRKIESDSVSLAFEEDDDSEAMLHPESADTPRAAGSEVPSIITLIHSTPLRDKPFVQYLAVWENQVFALVPLIIILIVSFRLYLGRKAKSSRLQGFVEIVVDGLDNFICELMGKKNGRRFLPYIGSLFIFILINDWLAVVPFLKSPTSSFRTTFSLALVTMVYVQVIAVKELGVLGYLHHLAGSPRGIVMWLFVPMLFPLHVIGEIAKVFSLSLRLFGNVFGEDTLIGVAVLLGLLVMGAFGIQRPLVGFPLQLPFMFLAILTGFIQAAVFSLLAAVYFVLVLPESSGH